MRVPAPTGSFTNCSRAVDERLLGSVCFLAIVVPLLSISSTNNVVIRHVEEIGKCRAALLVGCESGGRTIEIRSPICTLS